MINNFLIVSKFFIWNTWFYLSTILDSSMERKSKKCGKIHMIQSCKLFSTSLEIRINTNSSSYFWCFWCPSLRGHPFAKRWKYPWGTKQSRFLFCLSSHIFYLQCMAIVYQYDIKARKIPKWMGRIIMKELNIFCKTTFWEHLTSKKISSIICPSMSCSQNQFSSTTFANSIIIFLFFDIHIRFLKKSL